MQLSRRDIPDLMRSTGGVLFALGAIVLLTRKSGHHEWSHFVQFLVVLIPAVILYVLALGGVANPPGEDARPWQSVLMVTAILLGPVVLLEFLAWVGANTHHVLYDAGVFAVTGLLAGYAARRARVSYAALLAGLSLLVTWLLVWEKILGHPSANTYRWLLVAAAALLLLVAARLARRSAIGAGEVAIAGGVAAVAAGVLGVIIGFFVGVFRNITNALGASGSLGRSSSFEGSRSIEGVSSIKGSGAILSRSHTLPNSHILSKGHIHPVLSHAHLARPTHLPNLLVTHTNGLQHFGWDLYLLIASLALVWIGSRARFRGLGYVGGVGLLAFLISIGSQITRLESGRAPSTGIVGWPLALLIVGLVGLAAPMLTSRRES
jgi:hypothetical protein